VIVAPALVVLVAQNSSIEFDYAMLVPGAAFPLTMTRIRIQHHAFLVQSVAKGALVLLNSIIAANFILHCSFACTF
jgi:UDP-N-acetylmuramyl pentapeptide synthase